jgi:hypothetical protein
VEPAHQLPLTPPALTTRWETYLVEQYRPGLSIDELRGAAGLVHAAVTQMEREGSTVRFVCSTIVPQDEALLSLFEATSEGLVREAHARAGVAFERISSAVPAKG